MPLPVIPALFKEMGKRRRDQNKGLGDVAKAVQRSKRTVERWEKAKSLPLKMNDEDPGGDLARAVDGYAQVLGDTSPFDLWEAALERAKRERAKYERTLAAKQRPKRARAKQVARPSGRRQAP